MSHLSPFDVGQIKAHLHHGLSGATIAGILRKPDGKSTWSEQAIQDAIRRFKSEPHWRGERSEGSGRPRETSKAQDRAIVREVLKNRGRRKVTVPYLRKKFPWTKKFGDSLLEDRLHEGGLKKMRRRKKSLVTKAYLAPRVTYCNNVIKKHQSTLNAWG